MQELTLGVAISSLVIIGLLGCILDQVQRIATALTPPAKGEKNEKD